jgi:hypothetical protein
MRMLAMPTRTNRIPVAVRIRVTVVAACALRAVGVPRCTPVLVVAVAVEVWFGDRCGSHFFQWLMRVGLGRGWVCFRRG